MTDINIRLEELARENAVLRTAVRRTNRVLLSACLIAIVAFTAGAANLAVRKNADFEVVTARQVRIVDEDGKAKVLIAGNKQSNPQIVQGYVAVLDDIGNASALLGHWGNGDVLWFTNGDSHGNNLYLGTNKDAIVVQSANTKVGKFNFKLYADGTKSGIDFAERSSTITTPADLKHTISTDLKAVGNP